MAVAHYPRTYYKRGQTVCQHHPCTEEIYWGEMRPSEKGRTVIVHKGRM